jgi:hypothetical protein
VVSGDPGNAPSRNPIITDGGTWVIFETEASNLPRDGQEGRDRNGVADVYIWTHNRHFTFLVSATGVRNQLTTPSSGAATSPHGNYVLYENADQVYLRYLGAK